MDIFPESRRSHIALSPDFSSSSPLSFIVLPSWNSSNIIPICCFSLFLKFSENEYPLQELTDSIISAAIEVHRELGPGFLEKIYENALAMELEARGHKVDRQVATDVIFRGMPVCQHRIDLMIDDSVIVDLKSVDALVSAHKAQLRSTLKAAGKRVGLLMNFNQATLASGLKRIIN